MTTLAPHDRQKLAKLLGLLGSDQAGERDAAGLAAHRLMQKSGLDWGDLLAMPRVPHREPLHGTWRTTYANLMQQQSFLRPWEKKFVGDLPNFQRLSSKQRYILSEIADRVLGVGAARGGHT